MTPDPYAVLELPASASDEELRAAHRRLVSLHHPDHGGSPARFAEVQDAYARIRAERTAAEARRAGEDDIDARLAAIERELQAARGGSGRTAHGRGTGFRRPPPPPPPPPPRPRESDSASDAELGYVRTDDSFAKIIDDWLDGRS